MLSQPKAAPAVSERPASLLTLAVWAGIVTGFGELVVLRLEPVLRPGFLLRSRDALWMIPAFDAGLFGLAGLALVVVARVVPLSWRVAAGLLAGLGALLALLLRETLHPLAVLVLATGIGMQVARVLTGRVSAATRLVGRSLPWLALSVCALAVGTVGWRVVRERRLVLARPPAAPGAPNVLLLILDTVRAADLSLYGYARPTSPELERIAERATVFERAFAPASWTLPSHASMFTGRWPFELGVTREQGLGERWPTLAQLLRARGYATAAFAGNTYFVNWETGLSRGFEHFDDYPVSWWTATQSTAFGEVLYGPIRRVVRPIFSRLPVLWRLRLPPPRRYRSAKQITGAFLGWLDRARPTPFFAFLNFNDAHPPYTPPDSFRSRFHSPRLKPPVADDWTDSPKQPLTPADTRPKRDVYDGSIAYLDSELGRLFRELDRRRLLDNTLVIVTSDHGDEFAEHGLVSHGYSLYRHSLHVPLLIRFPRHVPEGRRATAPVSLINLAATVLDLLDIDQPTQVPGRSLARFWMTEGAAPDTIVASVTQLQNEPDWYPASRGALNSTAFDGWRYIRNEGDRVEELYDFESDVLERWNLVGSERGDRLVARYRAALDAVLAGAPQPPLAQVDRR